MRDFTHPADQLVRAMERIYRYRMTTTSGGNLSIRDENGDIWITPARVDKGSLRRDDIVCVRADGTVEGRHKPSSEFPFHRHIYELRPDLNAIVHAHPVALVAFSICGSSPDTRLFAKARRLCGEVGFAPYALPGSVLLGERIAEVFAKGPNCVMLENHGVVVGGEDFNRAFRRFETLEFTAKTIIKARALGEVRYLDSARYERVAQRPPAVETFEPDRASSAECAARAELCDFVRRGYQQRLLISTKGSFSARLGGDDFVITARGGDRAEVTPADLVRIKGGRAEAGLRPSHALALHRAIYLKHPEIRAIVNATPVNATAFAVSATPFDTRTIPESYIFLRDVAKLPFEDVYFEPEKAAASMRADFPVALVENDGVLVLGRTILDAFDRLEVLESTAEALINSRALGEVRPMNDAVIDELIQAFLT